MTITGFSTASDSIIVASSYDDRSAQWAYAWKGTVNPFYAQNEAAAASYNALASAALTALDTGGASEPGYYFGVYNGDGYLFYDNAGDGITDVIKLVGVTTFDAIDVCAPGYYNQGGTGTTAWTTPTEIGNYDFTANYETITRTDTFTNARIEALQVKSGFYGGNNISANLTLEAATAPSGDVVGSLSFRQADIEVSGSGLTGDGHLTVNDAHGTIDSLRVSAEDYSIATADFNDFSGAVREISVSADDLANASVSISGLQENVQQLWMSAYRGDTTADITLTDGYVARTDVYLQSDAASPATATLTVTQADHGGEVFAASSFDDAPAAETAVFELTYQDATADQILLCYEYDPETGVTSASGDFEGTFHLNLNKQDVDTNFDPANILTVIGWDSGTALAADVQADDTISFEGPVGRVLLGGDVGQYLEDLVAESNLNDFLAAADSALNSTVDYYFGVVGTNGYLAYDADGIGISQVIEFQNMTDFNATRIITNEIV